MMLVKTTTGDFLLAAVGVPPNEGLQGLAPLVARWAGSLWRAAPEAQGVRPQTPD